MKPGSKKLNIKLVGCDMTDRHGCDITPVEDFIAKLPDIDAETFHSDGSAAFKNATAVLDFCKNSKMQETFLKECGLVCRAVCYHPEKGYTLELTDPNLPGSQAQESK